MKRSGNSLVEKLPTALGILAGIVFAVAVGCFVLLPLVGLLRCVTLWAVTLALLVLWGWFRFRDREAESRVVSDPLQVERLDQRFGRRLSRCLVVRGLTDESGDQITVDAGFPTDYSSIPAPCRPIVHWSKVDVAGVVHDHLYKAQQRSRRDDDYIWWLLARAGKWRADPIQAWLCWLALRGFGWTSRPGGRQFNPGWYLLSLLLGASAAVWISRLICCVVGYCCAT